MGLRLKILSGFLILALMLLMAGIWSIYHFKFIGSSVQNLLDVNYRSINASMTMLHALEREDSAVLLLLLGKWEKGRTVVESADSLFNHGYAAVQNSATGEEEKSVIDGIGQKYDRYSELWEKPIVGTSREGDINWYFGYPHKAFMDVKESVFTLMDMQDREMYQIATDLKNRANRATMPGIVSIVAALVFSLIFSYFVNYFMVNPIVKMSKGIKAFREKNVPFEVKVNTRDEIAELAFSVRNLCSKELKEKNAR